MQGVHRAVYTRMSPSLLRGCKIEGQAQVVKADFRCGTFMCKASSSEDCIAPTLRFTYVEIQKMLNPSFSCDLVIT